MIRFDQRSDQLELMDDLSEQGPELEKTLRQIERINRSLGGYPPSLEGLRRLCPPGAKRLSVLDVGTGSADTPRRMIDWGRARGLEIKVTGIDIAERSVAHARRCSRDYPELEVELRDLHEVDDRFDVVHAAMVLHHFSGDRAAEALAKMFELSRHGIVVNDLHRHPAAWVGITALTRALTDNPMIRNDAPLSVLRAFTRSELEELVKRAGLPPAEIVWRPMFRWRMIVRKSG